MAYEKQYFRDGEILKAEQLNHIEAGIEELEKRMDEPAEPDEPVVEIEVVDPMTATEEGHAADAYKTRLAIESIEIPEVSGGGLEIIPKTVAEYEALTEEEKMRDDVIYRITDRNDGAKFGNTDISGVGDGTITGAIGALDDSLNGLEDESFINRGMLTADDDLNNILVPGIYQYATASVPQNCPFKNAGVVEVIKSQSKYIQRVTRYGTIGQSAERVYNTDWLAWVTKCAPVNLGKTADITAAANTYTKVTTVSIPAKSFYTFTAFPIWYNYCPMGVRICSSDNVNQALAWQEQSSTAPYMVSATVSGYADKATTYYVYAKWNGGGLEQLHVQGFYIPAV